VTRVKIVAAFEAYEDGKIRRFTAGEEPDLPEGRAELYCRKGLARLSDTPPRRKRK
jgi:hypothetical protein